MNKYQIRLRELPPDRIAFLRSLRLVGNLGLRQADDLARHLDRFRHSVLVAGVEQGTADHIAASLIDAGAKVEVETSSVDSPMLCTPTVNDKFRWGGWGPFRLIRKAS